MRACHVLPFPIIDFTNVILICPRNPPHSMKKFLHSDDGASKRAALIIVLAFVVLATVLGPANLNAAPAPAPPASPTQSPSPSPAPTPTGTPVCYVIVSAQPVNAGSNYKVGDTLDPVSGTLCDAADNYGFRLQVTSVNGSGGVTGVTIFFAGIGYWVVPPNPIRFGGSASGTGFTANCTFQPR
jgi:hypothetical protein